MEHQRWNIKTGRAETTNRYASRLLRGSLPEILDMLVSSA